MLIGYVSDERYVALADVSVEFERGGESSAVARSTPNGAIHATIEPGAYRVTLAKPGFGPKRVTLTVPAEQPHQFRLLSDRLLGYAWPRAVRSGESSEFKVHSVEAYRLSLWRYGWRKDFVRLLGWFDEHGPNATMQITPDGDYTQTGVHWNTVGYPQPNVTQIVAAPERSGLYYFHAEGESGAFFSFPWVVAPATPQAPIAVLASTNTWNAYNNFGGRSNYINSTGLPLVPVVNARQDLLRYQTAGGMDVWGFPDADYPPLSFDRPEPFNHVPAETQVTDPIGRRQPCHLAPTEWRFLGWLEREGFAYDMYSEWQLHSGILDLDAYRVLVISVHPEYWSRAMFDRVQAWVQQRGGHLLYLGGNGVNCEVEFLDDATLHFKTYRGSAEEQHGLDSRFHRTGESEAALLGVAFSYAGIMTAAPYRVVREHWTLAGTGLQVGDIFGQASLHERISGGASGHETDKRTANSPAGTILLAKGLNPDNGGAEMVYYETASGGAVFSVGSITYVASLLVDPAVSRITSNVLTRFLDRGDSAS